MYNNNDPPHGSGGFSSLPNPINSFHPYRPIVMIQKPHIHYKHLEHVRILELRNEDVELPRFDDSLIWCKMFKLDDMKHKHHIIRVCILYLYKL